MECTGGGKSELAALQEQFPVGLRVLVVDDDVCTLRVLEQMLRKCMYKVTSCSRATVALDLLRERKGCFDIVLSDVHMPDMDGFKLLELVGLEMDLPVIMMSADGRTNLVMRGVRHGACDYFIKPIRDEELKNIWQHIVRKRWNGSKEHDHSGCIEDHDRQTISIGDAEFAALMNGEVDDVPKTQKKRKDSNGEDDLESENDDSNMAKKPRVVWSIELHQQFVSAVTQLGIDKAVPKRILELMNVPGLTRENVASHLQKFRLYLKRLSGADQQVGFPVVQNRGIPSMGRFDIQALPASCQLPHKLAALHSEILSRPAGNLVLSAINPTNPLHASLQVSKCILADRNISYGQPAIKCSLDIAKQISQPTISNQNVHSESAVCSGKNHGDKVLADHLGSGVETSSNVFLSFIQQQPEQYTTEERSCSINVQPSCLVVPSESSTNFQAANGPLSINQDYCSFRNSLLDYGNPSLEKNNLSGVEKIQDVECRSAYRQSNFSGEGSLSSTSTCSRNLQLDACQRVPSLSSTFVADLSQGLAINPVYVGRATSIPSRFAVDECELQNNNSSQVKIQADNGGKVKQEPGMDLMENVKVGIPMRHQLHLNEVMSVFFD